MCYVFFNIGNRDVQLTGPTEVEGETIGPLIPMHKARELGKRVLDDYHRYAKALCFPMVKQVLSYIALRQHVNEVFLVVSDQDDETFQSKDTISFGQVIKRFIDTSPASPCRGQGTKVRLLPVRHNPADYDNMNKWYEDNFSKLAERLDATKTVYLALGGGTPAMNTFALFHGVGFFGERARALYSPEGDRRPVSLHVGGDFILKRLQRNVLLLVAKYDYHAAAAIVADMGHVIDERQRQMLTGILNYAHARVSFNFVEAADEIEKAIHPSHGRIRDELLRLRKDVYSSDEASLIAELATSIELKAKCGEYIDLLGRMFRLHEASCRLFAQRAGVGFDRSGRGLDKEWLEEKTGLREFLDGYRLGDQPLNYLGDANRRVLMAVLEYMARVNADVARFITITERIDRLATLRNATPVAHGFGGVSRNTLDECYGGLETLMADVEEIVRLIGVTVSKPFYVRVNDLVKEVFAGQV